MSNTSTYNPSFRGVIQFKLLTAVQDAVPDQEVYCSPSQGIIVWNRNGRSYGFETHLYNELAWRITNQGMHWFKVPKRFKFPFHPISLPTDFELSFIEEDLPLIATPELVRFVESMFDENSHEKVYRWKLFSHDSSYPHYAWTKRGSTRVERQQRQRARERAKLF